MDEEALNLLKAVFGEQGKIVRPLLGGMMNRSYIVQDGNEKKYVLYISTPQANDLVNRNVEKDNQNIVYQLGLTSKNLYFDTKKGNKINEYIDGNSLNYETSWDYEALAKLFKRLHQSKVLSQINYNPFIRFIDYENDAKKYLKDFDEEYLQLRKAIFDNREYLEKQKLCLCHNDAQRSNIVKSVNDEYFLIDFEFAANNDPIYDIATFGNNDVNEGRKLLDCYFDNNPTKEQIKRYYLWRIFVSLQWYNVAISKHYSGEGKVHQINFLDVSKFFLANAKEAYKNL